MIKFDLNVLFTVIFVSDKTFRNNNNILYTFCSCILIRFHILKNSYLLNDDSNVLLYYNYVSFYFIIASVFTTPFSSFPDQEASSPDPNFQTSRPTTTIIGVGLGSGVLVLIFLALLFVFLKRRRDSKKRYRVDIFV